MQTMVPLYGFGGVPYSAVRKAAPRNMLDNSDFTNLVAQADICGNHGTIAYAADRWILDSGTVSYEAGVGLTLNGTIRQKLEFSPTGETSAFVGMESGTASIDYADGAVTITSSGGVIKWAALYGGVYSAATMPDYQPKGYGAELLECQRYFYRLGANLTVPYNGFNSSGAKKASMYIGMLNMRIAPTVINNDAKLLIRDIAGYSAATGSSGAAPSSMSCVMSGGILALYPVFDTVITDTNSNFAP